MPAPTHDADAAAGRRPGTLGASKPPARVAVIGAGVAGLVCAYRVEQAGVGVDLYERWPGLGGQAATLDAGDGVRLERYYHYLFTSDRHMIELWREVGLEQELELHRPDAAILADGRVWPFNGVGDLARFRPLPFVNRVRMGLALFRMQFSRRGLEHYEGFTAREWIGREMGEPAWRHVWGPLMRGKFGERAEQISMAWIWDKAVRRRSIREGEALREAFLYPRTGFEPLFTELAARIESGPGRVWTDRPAARVARTGGRFAVQPGAPGSWRTGLDPQRFPPDGAARPYDAVVCCIPNDVFSALLEPELAQALGDSYRGRLESIELFTALNLLIELERPLTDRFWVNVADRRCPFVGVIEHSNLVGRERTGGRSFCHITNYLPRGHELLALSPDELLERYEAGLRIVNPAFEPSWVRQRWAFREPAGQPIVDLGYRERIPARRTPVPGLLLVNTTQIYPEDRGTNYAVRDGSLAAVDALEHLAAAGLADRPDGTTAALRE